MNRFRSRRLLLPLCSVGAYLILLELLLLVESGADGSSIKSLPDALWYSVTTLTTVGYGDLYPVTGAGRLIGLLFQLMSLGVLAAMVGLLLQLLRGRLAGLLLRFRQNRNWYIFTSAPPEACTLAQKLYKEDPDGVFLCSCAEGETLPPEFPGIHAVHSAEELAAMKKDPSSAWVFCMDPDCAENVRTAHRLQRSPCHVLCRSAYEPDEIPLQQIFYDPAAVCARLYWRRFPVTNPRENIVLVGGGRTAEALLEWALQNNLNTLHGQQELTYTCIGEYEDFLRSHPYLGQVCEVVRISDASPADVSPAREAPPLFRGNETLPSFADCLRIVNGPWNADWSVFRDADRIIFAGEDEEETEELLMQLFRYCPVTGQVHARLSSPFGSVEIFGGLEDLCTPELLLRRQLSRTARAMHEGYCCSVRKAAAASHSEPPQLPGWEELGCFLRRSNLASADHLLIKAGLLLGLPPEEALTPALCKEAAAVFHSLSDADRKACQALEHARWVRFHLMNNWQYAAVRNNAKRLHPLIVPFMDLSEADQDKDDGAWMLLDTLSENYE